MPRKNKNAGSRRPRPYRPDASAALERLELKRKRLNVTQAELASRVDISDRTLRNMLRDGRAWPRHIRALTFALRTIEQERPRERQVLE